MALIRLNTHPEGWWKLSLVQFAQLLYFDVGFDVLEVYGTQLQSEAKYFLLLACN